jgi:PKD repeat protein
MLLRMDSGSLRRLVLLLFAVVIANTGIAQTVASFTASASSGCSPLNVQFTNNSVNAASYSWDFGNASSSTLQNPSVIYTMPGSYNVTLTATGSSGSASYSQVITVTAAPVAAFTASVTTICQGGGAISFTNQSTGYDSCVWDFGDGTTTSLNNPSHIYNLPGAYSVTLVAYNNQNGCSTGITKNQYINILPYPSVSITVDDSSTCDQNHNFQFNAAGSMLPEAASYHGSGILATAPHLHYRIRNMFTVIQDISMYS